MTRAEPSKSASTSEGVRWELSTAANDTLTDAAKTLDMLAEADREEVAQMDAQLHSISGSADVTVQRALQQVSARRNHRAELVRMLEEARLSVISAIDSHEQVALDLRAREHKLMGLHTLQRDENMLLLKELNTAREKLQEMERRLADAENERDIAQASVTSLTETALKLGTELAATQGALDDEKQRAERSAQDHVRQIKEMTVQQHHLEDRQRQLLGQLDDRARALSQMSQLVGSLGGIAEAEPAPVVEAPPDGVVPAEVIRPALTLPNASRVPRRSPILAQPSETEAPHDEVEDTAEYTLTRRETAVA